MIKQPTLSTDQNGASQQSVVLFGIIGFICYSLYVIYATLVPFAGWEVPSFNIVENLLFDWVDKVYLFDIIQNILFYIPFGIFYIFASKQRRDITLLLLIAIYGFTISCSLELLQAYNPQRVSSLVDVIFNVLGCVLGAFVIILFKNFWLNVFNYSQNNIFKPISANCFLVLPSYIVIFAWGCFHLYSFIPTLKPSIVQKGLAPLSTGVNELLAQNFVSLDTSQISQHGILGAGLMILAYGCLNHFKVTILTLFISSVLLFKILIIGRAPTVEEFIGTLSGLWLAGILLKCLKSLAT